MTSTGTSTAVGKYSRSTGLFGSVALSNSGKPNTTCPKPLQPWRKCRWFRAKGFRWANKFSKRRSTTDPSTSGIGAKIRRSGRKSDK